VRFTYPNLTRPKKAAKRLAASLDGVSLSSVQNAVAVACGYRDWHEMARSHAAAPPTALDQELPLAEFRDRAVGTCRSLAATLGVLDGDVQAALPASRLTGDRPFTAEDHRAIRIACWRSGPMPWPGDRKPGSTFLVKVKGMRPKPAYRRPSDAAVTYVSDDHVNSGCGTSEAVSPRVRVEDFVPLRLWLPYGWWTLGDGSEVLFSRDYKPLWKASPDGAVTRMRPSLWIEGIRDQRWFAKEAGDPWHSGASRAMAEARLDALGITTLPRLADALPLLVSDDRIDMTKVAKRLDGKSEE
jgi:hypothetical protein